MTDTQLSSIWNLTARCRILYELLSSVGKSCMSLWKPWFWSCKTLTLLPRAHWLIFISLAKKMIGSTYEKRATITWIKEACVMGSWFVNTARTMCTTLTSANIEYAVIDAFIINSASFVLRRCLSDSLISELRFPKFLRVLITSKLIISLIRTMQVATETTTILVGGDLLF